MATVNVKRPPATVTLTLSEAEAKMLRTVLGVVLPSSPGQPINRHVDVVRRALGMSGLALSDDECKCSGTLIWDAEEAF